MSKFGAHYPKGTRQAIQLWECRPREREGGRNEKEGELEDGRMEGRVEGRMGGRDFCL